MNLQKQVKIEISSSGVLTGNKQIGEKIERSGYSNEQFVNFRGFLLYLAEMKGLL
jgi:hypothetical protein